MAGLKEANIVLCCEQCPQEVSMRVSMREIWALKATYPLDRTLQDLEGHQRELIYAGGGLANSLCRLERSGRWSSTAVRRR